MCIRDRLSAVNSEDYTLTGWYDNFGAAAGKKVRVIIADVYKRQIWWSSS